VSPWTNLGRSATPAVNTNSSAQPSAQAWGGPKMTMAGMYSGRGRARPGSPDQPAPGPFVLPNPAQLVYDYIRDQQARNGNAYRTYITYVLYDAEDNSYYVGKASAPGVQTGEQVFNRRWTSVALRLRGYELQQIDTLQVGRDDDDSEEYKAMRGREQQLYDYFDRGGQDLGNIYRPVSPINRRCREYHRAADEAFGVLSPANCLW
ncbi:MAG TPA: hypothetical protein VNR40_22245, partial [Steroidobacter sp.]|nr:hypothetical protein [Steroidobacter sp.]